jgi:hypothetical protein
MIAAKIRIVVCIPAFAIRRCITVSPDITIEDLKGYLPDRECDLIFEGSMLMGKMPLTFYSLGDGSMLFAVDRRTDSARIWTQVAANMDEFNERQRLRYDPHLSEEHARLKDLQLLRLLDRRRTLLRVGTMREERDMPSVVGGTVVCADGSVSPSVAPLPVCWGKDSRHRSHHSDV